MSIKIIKCFSDLILEISKENKLLDKLTPREQRILKLRFGLNGESKHTLVEIGNVFNLSRERIRQISYKALRKLYNQKYDDQLK